MMLLPALVSLPLLTASSPFVKRQSGTSIEDIDAQIRQVRAAAYAAQVIEAGDAIDVCGQAEPETGPPYDAELARTLICEAALGIDVFSESSNAVSDLNLALAGLERVAGSSNTLAENLPCNDPPVKPLNEAGLDGPDIWTLICEASNTATATTATPTSGLGGDESAGGQTESTLSQFPETTSSARSDSLASASPTTLMTTSSSLTSPLPPGTNDSANGTTDATTSLSTSLTSFAASTSSEGIASSETMSSNPMNMSDTLRPPVITTPQNISAADPPLTTSASSLAFSTLPASAGMSDTTNFSSPSSQTPSTLNTSSFAVPFETSRPSWVVGPPLSFPLPTSSTSRALTTNTANTTSMPTRISGTIGTRQQAQQDGVGGIGLIITSLEPGQNGATEV
ncbi:hypothetical protein KC331_g6780 [Hortaea werneckii]|nr:hypothetical protein KC331_g6780 [Hortaea werneckii]KAI7711632.1 hypothetical protein KC353_g8838 [Hortaea werneckii]